MPSIKILPKQSATFIIAASDKLATYSGKSYQITKTIGYPNLPNTTANVFYGTGANTTSAFSAATSITIYAGDAEVLYMTGTGPVIVERGQPFLQGDPGTLNATGTLTAALVLGGIVTSTTAAAVTATLDTGTVMDTVIDLAINDSFSWTAINTGGTNAFTVTASSGHTIVGNGAVALSSSGRFLTRRTAANTWITYRIS